MISTERVIEPNGFARSKLTMQSAWCLARGGDK